MSKLKKPYIKKSYESDGSKSDTFLMFYESMHLSPAWKSLGPTAKVLYFACKSQSHSEKHKKNPDQFTMNRSKWCHKYQIYGEGNGAGFTRDMTELIEKGFIICVECGANSRTKSVYQYSDMWLKYNTPGFEVPDLVKTIAMLGFKKRKNKEPP